MRWSTVHRLITVFFILFRASLASGANFIDERSFGAEYAGPRRVVGGLAVTTLGSGKLYIYLA